MQKQRIILIIGIILSLTSLVIVKVYIDQKQRELAAAAKRKVEAFKADFQQNQVSVLIAKQEIPKGSTIEAEALDIAIVPRDFVQPQVVTSLDRITGMITIAPFAAGEQITLSKLSPPRQAGGLAEITPVGKRATMVGVDNISTLIGMLRPGDYVDVFALLGMPVQTPQGVQTNNVVVPLFQNVLVLAVGADIGGPPQTETRSRYRQEETPADPNANMVTLALSPQEASIMAFAAEQGKIRLILRSPTDSQIQQTMPANWDTLFQYIMPNVPNQPQDDEELAPASRAQELPTKPKEDTIEIYRGMSKDTVTISK